MLHASLLAPKNFRWLLDTTCKICERLLLNEDYQLCLKNGRFHEKMKCDIIKRAKLKERLELLTGTL